jgi:branched-chain amino acid transport system substrate-binding protein
MRPSLSGQRWPLLAVLFAFSLVAAACPGAEEPATAPPAAPAEPVEPEEAPTPAPAPDEDEPEVAAPAGDPIRIGLVGPFTGPIGKPGQDLHNSATIAAETLNEQGGILGRPVELVIGDDMGDPAQAISVARRMCDDDSIIGIVAAQTSAAAIPASEIYQECGLLHLNTTATSPTLTDRGLDNVLRISGRDDLQAALMVAWITQELNPQTVYIIDDRSTAGAGLADGAEAEFREAGVEVVRDSYTGGGAVLPNFIPFAERIRQADPDVVYMALNVAREAAEFIRTMKDQGIEAQFVGSEAQFETVDFIEGAGGAAEGVYIPFTTPDIREVPAAQDYLQRFEEQFGELGGFGPAAYEGVMLMAHVLEQLGDPDAIDRRAVIEGARNVQGYEGILGFPITFNEQGDVEGGAFWLYRVEGDRFVMVKRL